jgi:flagellar biosynthesis chaperone FliJ
MNKERRKALAQLATEIEELKGKLDDCKTQLETIKDEEQEYRDNMPENLQDGEKAQHTDEVIEALETGFDTLDTIDSELQEVLDNLQTAQE